MGVRRAAGRGGDVPAGADDPVERGPVHHQVLDHRERRRPPRLDVDGVAVLEVPHVQLAGGGALGAVRPAVDDHAAGAADPLAAVVVEGDGGVAAQDQLLVEGVQHLQEGHVGADPADLVGGHRAGRVGARLAPDPEGEVHA